MTAIRNFLKRSSYLTVALLSFAAWVVADVSLFSQKADAAQLTARKLTISSSANGSIGVGSPGTGGNGNKAKYTFAFTIPTTGNVGSVLFQVCTTPLPGTTCTAPTGFTAANATSVATTGTGFTGFSVDTSTNLTGAPYSCSGTSPGRANCIGITRTAASVTGGAAVTAEFGGGASDYITNPTTDNAAFFVRITTYSDNAFATPVDQGSVANSTAQQIDITAKVQETLNFSVGATTGDPGAGCAAISDASGALALGDPTEGTLSFQQAYDAHSYFRVSTNANGGTVVYYSGDTLKSGANSITAAGTTQPTPSTAVASAVGTSQFGLAIDSSDTGTGKHSFTNLAASAPYTAGNGTITNGGTALFAFAPSSVTTPVAIASASGTVTCDTGSVRYLGNISTTTPPGIYTTTITYIATPTY